MLDTIKKMQIRQDISFGRMNKSQLAKANGITRPTLYKYIKELEKEGYESKRVGKDTIVESNTNKNLGEFLVKFEMEIMQLDLYIKDVIRLYKKPHPRSKKVDLTHKKYRYRLALFNNTLVRLLTVERGIFYLKSISKIKKQSIQELDVTSKKCLDLMRFIQEEVIKITPEREDKIIDFFASNIMGSVYPPEQKIKTKRIKNF